MTVINQVGKDIYQINTYDEKIGLSFNQYLIVDKCPILIHTGPIQLYEKISRSIEKIISIQKINYVFISHFESDECGALSAFLKINKKLTPVCSEITARQIRGFEIAADPIIKRGSETLNLGGRELTFLDYPSEMHLWKGLIAYEPIDEILYSSDIFIRWGKIAVPQIAVDILKEIEAIPKVAAPNPEMRDELIRTIKSLKIKKIAPGHGPILDGLAT